AVTELSDAIVELDRARKRIERGAEFRPAPPDVMPFRGVADRRRKTEIAASRERAAPFQVHASRLRNQRVAMDALAQADRRRVAAGAPENASIKRRDRNQQETARQPHRITFARRSSPPASHQSPTNRSCGPHRAACTPAARRKD